MPNHSPLDHDDAPPPPFFQKEVNAWLGVLILLGATSLSIVLAMTADLRNPGLGALFHFIIPLLTGMASINVFLLFRLFWSRSAMVVLIIMVLLNAAVGLMLHLQWGLFYPV